LSSGVNWRNQAFTLIEIIRAGSLSVIGIFHQLCPSPALAQQKEPGTRVPDPTIPTNYF